jgi:PAS domain S-box-containing protein
MFRVQLTASSVHGSDGRPIGVVTVARSLMERAQADQALRESEARYRSLFEASPDAVLLTDLKAKILVCNRQAAALHGFNRPGALVGRTIFDFISPEDHAHVASGMQRTLERGSVPNLEYSLLRDDGSSLPVELNSALVVDGHGSPQAVTSIVRDLSTRKQVEEDLRRQSDLYEGLLQAQSDLGEGVAISDTGGRILYVNEALCKLYGYTREEMLARSSWRELMAPDLLPGIQERFERRMSGGSLPDHYDLAAITKNGDRVEVELAVKRVQIGDQTQVIALIRDITARKRLEAELTQSEKLRSLGVMASGVAHHINNVLAGVLGQADLLLETAKDPLVRRRLETIIQSAQDGATAVHRIKQFSYAVPLETFERIDLRSLANDVIAATEPRWNSQAGREGRVIEVKLVGDSPVWVHGVASELRETIMNLVLNAVDVVPSGGSIFLEVGKLGDRAFLRVVDDGAGMPADVLERVYDPFFTTKPLGQGTGLGLAVAYGVVQRHGGTIDIRSDLGRGTTVEIQLPAAPAAEATAREPTPPADVPPLRVLVVDDEPALAEQLNAILNLDSHKVRVCHGGAEALVALREEHFDLVLTDLSMPGITGWSVAREAKERLPGTLVGVVTGWVDISTDPDRAEQRVADFVIAKPYRVQSVRQTVAAAVADSATRPAI